MATELGAEIRLPVPYADAVRRVRDALTREGFGVLSEIDMREKFKEKLDRDFRPYLILGACRPPLAYEALLADPAVGLLLPCNVTVEADGPHASVVRLTDPGVLLRLADLAGTEALRAVSDDAGARLGRVAEALGGGSP